MEKIVPWMNEPVVGSVKRWHLLAAAAVAIALTVAILIMRRR